MYLGIGSFAYGWSVGTERAVARPMDEIALIQEALRLGVSCVQIGDNIPLHTFSEDRLRDLMSMAAQNKLRLEIGARKLTRQNLETYISIASSLKSPLLRFVIDGQDYEPSISEVSGIVQEFAEELKSKNLILGIENHDRFKVRDLARLMTLCNSPHVGICLDTTNSLGAGEGLEQVVSFLGPFTVNLHIKDFVVERLPHKMGFSVFGVAAGKGLIDIPWLLEEVEKYGRCQSVILEQWIPPLENIDETIEQERHCASESIQYLQSLKDWV